MMDAQNIIAIEARLRAARIPVTEVCRRAGINRMTWQRWKAGSSAPRRTSVAAIERALADLLPAEAA